MIFLLHFLKGVLFSCEASRVLSKQRNKRKYRFTTAKARGWRDAIKWLLPEVLNQKPREWVVTAVRPNAHQIQLLRASELRDTSYLISLLLLFMSPRAERVPLWMHKKLPTACLGGADFKKPSAWLDLLQGRISSSLRVCVCIVAAFVAHSLSAKVLPR